MGGQKLIHEDETHQVWAIHIQREDSRDDAVLLIEFPSCSSDELPKILANSSCQGVEEAWQFAEEWAEKEIFGLSDTEKTILRIIAWRHHDDEEKVHYSTIGDYLAGSDEQASQVLFELADKSLVTLRSSLVQLSRKGEKAVQDIGLLPDNLRGRNIHQKVIPTVCNLRNMLEKLVSVEGDYSQLEQWEQRIYTAYNIDEIKDCILGSCSEEWPGIVKGHILSGHPDELGASCIDIYLVAYVSETNGTGRQNFFDYVKESGISDKENSAQAIWQVGKGDGLYLDILNDDGTVKDWDFIARWVAGIGCH